PRRPWQPFTRLNVLAYLAPRFPCGRDTHCWVCSEPVPDKPPANARKEYPRARSTVGQSQAQARITAVENVELPLCWYFEPFNGSIGQRDFRHDKMVPDCCYLWRY